MKTRCILLAATEDCNILVFDPRDFRRTSGCNRIISGHFDCVNIIKPLPHNSNQFLSGSGLCKQTRFFFFSIIRKRVLDDTTVRLFDVRKTNEAVKTFFGHTSWVKNIEIINNDCFISSAFDGTIRKWFFRECNGNSPSSSFLKKKKTFRNI